MKTQEKKVESPVSIKSLQDIVIDVLNEATFVPTQTPELEKATEAYNLAKVAFDDLKKSKDILSSLARPNFKYADEINQAIELMDYMMHDTPERRSIFRRVLGKVLGIKAIFSKHGECVD